MNNAVASGLRAPIIQRPRNFQWYWNSVSDTWFGEHEEWQTYTDVENEIIEDAYNARKTQVEIDGDYMVNLEFFLQYNRFDNSNTRQIKRVELDSCRNVRLRDERFSYPIKFATSSSSSSIEDLGIEDTLEDLRKYGDFPDAYYELELQNKNKTIANIIEQAADGILKEGISLGEKNEAQWLSQQLLAVKHFGTNAIADRINLPPEEIGATCIRLYTMSSFWYSLINRVLRNPTTITRNHIKTLGPFCYLLELYLMKCCTNNIATVYRGLDLNEEQRREFMNKEEVIIFKSFISTSANRKVAEIFSTNTLLVIDLNVKHPELGGNINRGAYIALLSHFPEEEEFLIWPSTEFNFVKYELVDNKHIIYLKSADEK